MTNHDQSHAAPPDAAGHVGAKTVPSDVLNYNSIEKEQGPQPALHAQVPPRAGGIQSLSLFIWFLIAACIVMGFLIAFR